MHCKAAYVPSLVLDEHCGQSTALSPVMLCLPHVHGGLAQHAPGKDADARTKFLYVNSFIVVSAVDSMTLSYYDTRRQAMHSLPAMHSAMQHLDCRGMHCSSTWDALSAAGVQEVCRCLEVDLTGQTSASYNMRLNYEKCLLEFEMYLASGQYEIDLSVGNAPSPDEVTYTNTKREVMNTYMPPPVMSLSSAPSSAGPSAGTMTLRERAPRCARPHFSLVVWVLVEEEREPRALAQGPCCSHTRPMMGHGRFAWETHGWHPASGEHACSRDASPEA